MPRDTWFKCDPIDFLDGLETCANETEVSVYCVVCFRIYANGGAIPNNPETIASYAKSSRTKVARAIAALVQSGKLQLVENRLMNRRAGEEIAAREGLSATRAKVGSAGGSARKSEQSETEVGAKSTRFQKKSDQSEIVFEAEPAENRGSGEAIASSRAREDEEEIERTPQPPKGERVGLDGKPIPDFANMPDPDPAKILERKLAQIDPGDPDDGPDMRELTGRVMNASGMAYPPGDFNLIKGWIALGIDPDEIVRTVARLAATARSPVRGMRYFDRTIREEHEAKAGASNAFQAEMRRVAIRNGMSPEDYDRKLAEMRSS